MGVGRLECIGLSAAGQEGLVRVLELLEDEVNIALGLLGVNGWEELNTGYLHAAPTVMEPHVLSAFPHLRMDEGY